MPTTMSSDNKPRSNKDTQHHCNNCEGDSVHKAAMKKVRLQRQRNTAMTSGKSRKVLFTAKLTETPSVATKVTFSIKSNFKKVHRVTTHPRGHYLHGKRGGSCTQVDARTGPDKVLHQMPPRPATVSCDLIITSPRRASASRTEHCGPCPNRKSRCEDRGHQGQPQHNQHQRIRRKQTAAADVADKYPPGEKLFVPLRSVVIPQDINNEDLRFLFKYGVHLPVLSGSPGVQDTRKDGQLMLGYMDNSKEGPTPSPFSPLRAGSEDKPYLIHQDFIDSLPYSNTRCNDETDISSLCKLLSIDAEGVMSELSLNREAQLKGMADSEMANDMRTMSMISHKQVENGQASIHYSVNGTELRSNSALSKMTSYSWHRLEEDKKLPQVTDNNYYRSAHASADMRYSGRKITPTMRNSMYGLSKSARTNMKTYQATRTMSDNDEGVSDISSLNNNDTTQTQQLVQRINEIDALQAGSGQNSNIPRSHVANLSAQHVGGNQTQTVWHQFGNKKQQNQRGVSDNRLYNKAHQSSNWLSISQEAQAPFAILGHSLCPPRIINQSKVPSFSQSYQASKNYPSAETYLDYVKITQQTIKQSSPIQKATNVLSTDAVESVLACNRPMPIVGSAILQAEYEKDECSTSSNPAGHHCNMDESTDDPFMVNSVLLKLRPPPKTPKHVGKMGKGQEIAETKMQHHQKAVSGRAHKEGRGQNIFRVDLRSAMQVS